MPDITILDVIIEKQLNKFSTQPADKGTINADSTHDELNPNMNKNTTHDDQILYLTCATSTTCANKGTDSIMQNPLLYSGEDTEPIGYLPTNNFCYILDSHSGSVLKGLNQFLDSASTPDVCEFIENMILHFNIKKGANLYKYTEMTTLTKSEKDKLYKFVMFKSPLNMSGDVKL